MAPPLRHWQTYLSNPQIYTLDRNKTHKYVDGGDIVILNCVQKSVKRRYGTEQNLFYKAIRNGIKIILTAGKKNYWKFYERYFCYNSQYLILVTLF